MKTAILILESWQWKQSIGIPTGINSALFWANLFLYSYEEEYMSSLISSYKIKARHFPSTKRFIYDLGGINFGGEFRRSFCDRYLISKRAYAEAWTTGKLCYYFEFGYNHHYHYRLVSLLNCGNVSYRIQ